MTIHEAVYALRTELGETQQGLSTKLGVSLGAVQRYEKDREPDVRSLALLVGLAQQANRPDLEAIFQTAVNDAMENAYIPGNLNGILPFRSVEEWRFLRAVQWALNDPRFRDQRTELEIVLQPVFEHMNRLGRKRFEKAKESLSKMRKLSERQVGGKEPE